MITKMDMAAAAEFDSAAAQRNILAVRPGMRIFMLSAKTGAGMEEFVAFLCSQQEQARTAEGAPAQAGALLPST